MEDKQLQKNEFIREKIKTKPLNKKRVAERVGLSMLCGALFAAAACVVFALFLPHILDTAENVDDTEQLSSQETETTELVTQAPEPAPATEVVEHQELTLEDYQILQNRLYAIGNQGNKSIVTISSVVSETDIFHNPYQAENQGSGVIIEDTGSQLLILTERKVIQDASQISVSFINETTAEASLKKYDGNTGLAVLSVDKKSLEDSTINAISVAEMGNSNLVSKGTIVLALGSPLGTNYSILIGNITSTNNEISTDDHNYSVFTTDIVASESGSGILVNVDGEVIGIVMQDYSASHAENTLTAVSITELQPTITMLSEGKDIPYLGLYVSTVTDKISNAYEIPKGVYIREVSMDSPAMHAGLQSGDVIVSINGNAVTTANAYSSQLMALAPGMNVPVIVKRQGAEGYSEITCQAEIGVLP